MHIVLIGDSIFDNEPYVAAGSTVSEQLVDMADNTEITLLARDGDVTYHVEDQLRKFPSTATHLFVSCGGNDALNSVKVLEKPVNTVGEAMDVFYKVTEEFRRDYRAMLSTILSKHSNLTACTIYNCVPDLPNHLKPALAVFNEIILEEAIRMKLPIIDLRVVCDKEEDYSRESPIEPSAEGGRKIAELIWAVANGNQGNNGVVVHSHV